MTKVKICGIRSYQDAKMAIDLGVEILGFNFCENSRRYITPPGAKKIIENLPADIWKVGLFVKGDIARINEIAKETQIDTLQLHNEESFSLLSSFNNLRKIAVIRVREVATKEQIDNCSRLADFVLLDSFIKDKEGGTGQEIEESLLITLKGENCFSRIFLAGGLRPDNVRDKILRFRPFAVDIATGVEISPGRKSKELISKFITEVQAADNL